MRAPHESLFDFALDNATHLAMAALGYRAEQMIDTAETLNDAMEPIFRNWVEAAGEDGIPEDDVGLDIAEKPAHLDSAENIAGRAYDASRSAVSAFGINPDHAMETTEEIADAIEEIARNIAEAQLDPDF